MAYHTRSLVPNLHRREGSKARTLLQSQQAPQLLQRPVQSKHQQRDAATHHADLLQVSMNSQQPQCVRLIVDALLEGRFSKVSMVLHMYDALQALIHDLQVCVLSGMLYSHLVTQKTTGATAFCTNGIRLHRSTKACVYWSAYSAWLSLCHRDSRPPLCSPACLLVCSPACPVFTAQAHVPAAAEAPAND